MRAEPALSVLEAAYRLEGSEDEWLDGLTQAAATGRIVADLIADRPPPVDILPFASTRF